LDQVHRRQHGQVVHGALDALPARVPVAAAQVGQRQEVGRVLRRVAHGPHDAVNRHDLEAARPSERRVGLGMTVVQRRQRLAASRVRPQPAQLVAKRTS
jgi:hypothetical protein